MSANWREYDATSALSGITIVVEEGACSSFSLICTMLYQALKNSKLSVCLITTRRPLSRYVTTCRKMGQDLSLSAIQSRFCAIDCVTMGIPPNPRFKSLDLSQENMTKLLIDTIQSFRLPSDGTLIIFEDVSIFAALSSNNASSIPAILNMIMQMQCYPNIVTGVSSSFGNDILVLKRWLIHRSARIVAMKPLSSQSESLYGELAEAVVVDGDWQSPQCYSYKCTDTRLLCSLRTSTLFKVASLIE